MILSVAKWTQFIANDRSLLINRPLWANYMYNGWKWFFKNHESGKIYLKFHGFTVLFFTELTQDLDFEQG